MAEKKKKQVARMFDRIAGIYDLGNHLLSLGQDFSWRKKLSLALKEFQPGVILDLAAGTADLAIALKRQIPDSEIIALDLAQKMLLRAAEKINRKKLQNSVFLAGADIEQMPFPDQSFDALTIGFGIRNLESRAKGLAEIFRILKPGGAFAILEFSLPESGVFAHLYHTYLNILLPRIGKILRGQNAYFYLRDTIQEFPAPSQFSQELNQAGFLSINITPLSRGIVTLYLALKPK